MIQRLAAVLLMGAVYFASALAWPSPAGAQVVSSRQAVCDPQYPTRCIKPAADGSIAVTGGGGGGGNTTVTATAAAPSYVEGSTTNPLSTNLTGDLRTIAKIASGQTVGISGTPTINLTGIGGVAPDVGNGVAGSGTFRVTIASDSTTPLPSGAATQALQSSVQGTFGAVTANRSVIYDAAGAAVDWTAAVPVTQSGTWNVGLSTGSNVVGAVTQSGTWTVQPGNTANTTPWLVTGSGTAGTAAAGVLSVQGIASMTPVQVSQATAANLNATVTQTTPANLTVLSHGAVTTAAPTYTNGTNREISLSTTGAVRVENQTGAGATILYQGTNADNMAYASGLTSQVVNAVLRADNGSTLSRVPGDTAGLVSQPYARRALRWNYAAAAGGISNTTTAVTIKAAAGASTKNCITNIQINSTALGTATELAVRDGAGGTVLWRTQIGTAGIAGTDSIPLTAAICGTDNTLMEVVTLTASGTGAVYFNAQGYTGP